MSEERPISKSKEDGKNITSLSAPVKRTPRIKGEKRDLIQMKTLKGGSGILHIRPLWTLDNKTKNPVRKANYKARSSKFVTGGLPRINFKGVTQQSFAAMDKKFDEEINIFLTPDKDKGEKNVEIVKTKADGTIDKKVGEKAKEIVLPSKDLEAQKRIAEQHVQNIEKQIEESSKVSKVSTKTKIA